MKHEPMNRAFDLMRRSVADHALIDEEKQLACLPVSASSWTQSAAEPDLFDQIAADLGVSPSPWPPI